MKELARRADVVLVIGSRELLELQTPRRGRPGAGHARLPRRRRDRGRPRVGRRRPTSWASPPARALPSGWSNGCSRGWPGSGLGRGRGDPAHGGAPALLGRARLDRDRARGLGPGGELVAVLIGREHRNGDERVRRANPREPLDALEHDPSATGPMAPGTSARMSSLTRDQGDAGEVVHLGERLEDVRRSPTVPCGSGRSTPRRRAASGASRRAHRRRAPSRPRGPPGPLRPLDPFDPVDEPQDIGGDQARSGPWTAASTSQSPITVTACRTPLAAWSCVTTSCDLARRGTQIDEGVHGREARAGVAPVQGPPVETPPDSPQRSSAGAPGHAQRASSSSSPSSGPTEIRRSPSRSAELPRGR